MAWGYGCFVGGVPMDAGGGGAPDVGFEATRNTNQTISPTVETIVDWNVKTADPTGAFSLATDTFTAPTQGRYTFTACVKLNTAAAGSGYLRIYKGATLMTETSDHASLATTLSLNAACVLWLAAGNTVVAKVYQNTGFNCTLQGCGNLFSGAQIYEA